MLDDIMPVRERMSACERERMERFELERRRDRKQMKTCGRLFRF